MQLERHILDRVCELTGARDAHWGDTIQRLWSGYGEIRRVALRGGAVPSVVVKLVQPPARPRQARGWSSERSHRRKLRSYQVELAFYRSYAERCRGACRLPRMYGGEQTRDGFLLVLQDLDAAGFSERREQPVADELCACLDWLAAFHVCFLGASSDGLWEVGTYWHLATRPDELRAVRDPRLRDAAAALDEKLNACSFATLVHGDAKVANFCFAGAGAGAGVAAVDFQYVGRGCGIKDVAYFLSSVYDEADCQEQAEACLDRYFGTLSRLLAEHRPEVDAAALEAEWRELYPVAWADFYRFLVGWAPDHYKIHGYSERMTLTALAALERGEP